MNLIIYINKSKCVSAYTWKMRYSVYSRGIWISRPIPISTSNTSVKPQCHSLTQTPSCGAYTVNQCLKKINPCQSSPSNCNPMKMNTRKVKVEVVAAQSSCQPPLSMEFSRQYYWSGEPLPLQGSSRPRDQTWVFCIACRFFTIWATREALKWTNTLKNVWYVCCFSSKLNFLILKADILKVTSFLSMFQDYKWLYLFGKTQG